MMKDTYTCDELIKLTEALLISLCGYSAAEARITAEVLVEADARNIPSHGVSRLDFYRGNLKGGFAKPKTEPEIVCETLSSLVVDGRDGIGPYIADFSVKRMLAKAEKQGAAFCSVRNSNHFGIAGFWAEKAARKDMIGLAFTNTRTCGIPTYGRERVLGTNPLCAAIPCGPEDNPRIFMLDMATTTAAHGKVEVYERRKKPMPAGWAVDDKGAVMHDATAFEKLFWENPRFGGHLYLGGEGEESGGHKGFGLGLLVELLCSGLSLGTASYDTFQPGRGSGITHFFGAVRLDLFGGVPALKAHIAGILDHIRNGAKAEGQERIYIHGEKETEARSLALKNGISLDEATCKMLESLRAEAGLDL
ncbi:MAG: Ldh family oxidoreductase [Treponema sp.]|jgi:LDH2 family malate/lactate/ureidoglycolate dehydrogenase|nr:Ldh family oxidoreductase [Treponema sp.]